MLLATYFWLSLLCVHENIISQIEAFLEFAMRPCRNFVNSMRLNVCPPVPQERVRFQWHFVSCSVGVKYPHLLGTVYYVIGM